MCRKGSKREEVDSEEEEEEETEPEAEESKEQSSQLSSHCKLFTLPISENLVALSSKNLYFIMSVTRINHIIFHVI